MHIVVLRKSEVTDLIPECLLFLMYLEVSFMRFEKSGLVLNFPAYTRTSTLVNKLDPATQSKGLEIVDRKVYIHA